MSLPTVCPLVFTVGEGALIAPMLLGLADCDLFESRFARFISSCADRARVDDVWLLGLLEEHEVQEEMVMIDSLWSLVVW